MGLPGVPGFRFMDLLPGNRYIDQFKNYCHQTFDQAKTKITERVNWVRQSIPNINWMRQKITDTWTSSKELFKPLYERYIEPLDRIDAYLASGCALVALSIILISSAIFGKPLIAASVLMGFTLMLGGWKFIRYRVEKKFNLEAKGICDNIVGIVRNATTYQQVSFSRIEKQLNKLRKGVKFEHIKENRSQLERKIEEFRRDGNQTAKFTDFKQVLINYLENVKEQLS